MRREDYIIVLPTPVYWADLDSTSTITQSGHTLTIGSNIQFIFDAEKNRIVAYNPSANNAITNTIWSTMDGVPAGNSPFTLCFWFKSNNSWGYNSHIIMSIGYRAKNRMFAPGFGGFASANPKSLYVFRYASDYSTGYSMSESVIEQWNHYCFAWDGTQLTVFMNGVMVATRTPSANSIQSNIISIFGSQRTSGTTETIGGSIYGVRIFDNILTEEQIYKIKEL